MILAYAAASRSPDPYKTVGAVAFRKDRSTVATGYNGAQKGEEVDWSDRDARRPFVVHAERNCLEHACLEEVHSLYVTLSPCSECLELMSFYGVKEVIYDEVYERDTEAFAKAKKYDITLRQQSLPDDYKKTLHPQL